MSNDRRLHEQVLVAICRELGVDIQSVSARVESGVVSLSGIVDTPAELVAVERAVWGVSGIRGMTQRMRARRTFEGGPTNAELVLAVLNTVKRNVRVRVEDGVVTLMGPFATAAERDGAAAAAASVAGVRGVSVADDIGTTVSRRPTLVSRIRASWA